MDALKYLKLDLRIMKGKNQYLLGILCLILIPFIKYNIEVGVTCLLVFMIIYAALPFSNENSEKLEKVYGRFPCKVSCMVLGRFMYLTILMIIMTIIYIGIYFWSVNLVERMRYIEMGIILTLATILFYGAYPIYYKAQKEKENMVMTGVIGVILLSEFSAVLLIPIISRMINALYMEEVKSIIGFIINNSKIFISIAIITIIITGCLFYLISCSICKRKEV